MSKFEQSETDCEICWDTMSEEEVNFGNVICFRCSWQREEEKTELLEKALAGAKARIDELMFEYCPDEMTPEQIAEYERNVGVRCKCCGARVESTFQTGHRCQSCLSEMDATNIFDELKKKIESGNGGSA